MSPVIFALLISIKHGINIIVFIIKFEEFGGNAVNINKPPIKSTISGQRNGGRDRNRTGDTRIFQSAALPTELPRHFGMFYIF